MNKLSFGSPFPTEYFKGDTLIKQNFINTNINKECVSTCREELWKLIDSVEISNFSKDFIKKCYGPLDAPFFLLPVSTSGKYHGGPLSEENSIGGIIAHYKKALKVSDRVIDRYKEILNRNSLSEFSNYVEVLRVSTLLHDIGRLGSDGSSCFSIKEHGEVGAEIIKSASSNFKFPFEFYIDPLVYAIYNHMYLWKFCNAWDSIINNGYNPSFVVGLMLSESDFFSTVY
jgi:hypothetical protein